MSDIFDIHTCLDCPCVGDPGVCGLDEERRPIPVGALAERVQEPPPDWCPLRVGTVTLRLRGES